MTKGSSIRVVMGCGVLALTFLGGACGGDSSPGGVAGASGTGATGGVQIATGGAGGGATCRGPVTEAQVASICAETPAGSSVMVIADADCGQTISSSSSPLVVVTPVTRSAASPDGGPADAGLSPIASISVTVSIAGEIKLANPGATGLPAGPQTLVQAGDGTSLDVSVPGGFDIGQSFQTCHAQSGDVNVTLPDSLSGAGAAASFTAHCQPVYPIPPVNNLVGCFRL